MEGVLSQEAALDYGWTGPCLHSTGLAYDVRKAYPYLDYDKYDFDTFQWERTATTTTGSGSEDQ